MLYRYSFDSPVGCLRLEEEDGYLTGLHFMRMIQICCDRPSSS